MRLKASFVVENSFIAPLFTLIIVALMSLCLYIRDSQIIENGILIAAMKSEQEIRQKDKESSEYIRIIENTEDYIKDNMVVMKDVNSVWIEKELDKNYIKENYQPDFIRMINAVH